MSLRQLHPLLAAKAREELNEEPTRIEESLRLLKEWIAVQPHLKVRTDDQWLVAFLRGCKYNLDKTKSKIDLYYTLRTTAPEVYCIKYSESKIYSILETGAILTMPKTKGPADPRVILLRPGWCNPSDFTFMEVMAVMLFQHQISYMEDDNLTVAGMVNVVDLKGTSLSHIRQISIFEIRKLITVTQDAAATRMKGVHILNTMYFFETCFNLVKHFLNDKIRKRFQIHNKNYEEFYKCVPREVLPAEYGGDGGTMREIIDYWKRKFREYEVYYTNTVTRVSIVLGMAKIRELSPELAEIAKKELNENPKRTANDIQHLKDWLAKEPHLRARTDDQWLVALLRGCKFSLERVKEKLDLYYTLRTTAADVTLRRKPTEPEFLEFLRLGTCLILPKSSTLHPRAILIRAGRFDMNKYDVTDIMCILYYMVQILVMEDDAASIVGTIIVVDYEGCTMSHLTLVNPSVLRKLVAVSQDSLPLRLKGSHHLNVPTGVEIVFKLVSGFLNSKAKERLKIHKTYEELHAVLPKEVIPAEYGGSGGTVADITKYWENKIIEYKDWMIEEMKFGTDESLRLGKPQGVDISNTGSFRALEID
ncbi:unnamed protein product [Pieris brassicae]|uniref:CRAL-TRIO domain-containing protein n=2 Tax=Pieris brassicae TaxID=7116 RepID=A0A9P0X4T3_PIEBR|nr:unnamed protein product [Pieris brassicae]